MPSASGGRADDTDQEDRQNCDVKQYPWYLKRASVSSVSEAEVSEE